MAAGTYVFLCRKGICTSNCYIDKGICAKIHGFNELVCNDFSEEECVLKSEKSGLPGSGCIWIEILALHETSVLGTAGKLGNQKM